VLISGFNIERNVPGFGKSFGDSASGLTPFGALPSIKAKLDASRAAVEALHPGRSKLLDKPIYVSWLKIPYSLGCFANNRVPSSAEAYQQLEKPRAEPTSRETTCLTWWRGRKARYFLLTTPSSASRLR
jgi:monoamine oxidase